MKRITMMSATLALTLGISGCTQILDNVGMPPDSSPVSRIAQQDDQVVVTWTDDSPTSEGYSVQRRVNGADWEVLAEVDVNTREYVDSTPAQSGTYQYRVRSINRHGETFSEDREVVYDGILGRTVDSVDLPVDTNGDGRPDMHRSFTLVDSDGDGAYDGIDLDGKLSNAEFSLTATDDPGKYHVDTNGDGEPDLVYDVAAGGTERYAPALADPVEGQEAAIVQEREGDPPQGVAKGGRIDRSATDVLGTALGRDGGSFPWAGQGESDPDVTATVVDTYPEAPGAVDLDGDGSADAWIIGHKEDENGDKSYEIDASGNGEGDFWLTGNPFVQGSTGSHGEGEPIYPAFDDGGGHAGFGSPGPGGRVEPDNSLTDPVAGGGDDGDPNGTTFEVPGVSGGSGGSGGREVTLTGMPNTDSDGDGNPDPPSYNDKPASGLDTDGDGGTDVNIGGTDVPGVYGIDVDNDQQPELYMQTFPSVHFTANKDGSGARYRIVDDGTGVAGFDVVDDQNDDVNVGFEQDDGDTGLSLPDAGVAELSIAANHTDGDSDGMLDHDDTLTLTASLNSGSADSWIWVVNGFVVNPDSSAADESTLTIDLSDVVTGVIHRVVVSARGVSGSGLTENQDLSTEYTFAVQM